MSGSLLIIIYLYLILFYISIRLEEFKVTPTGKLSVQDFRNLWLEQQCDPPAFTRARKAAKIAKDKRQAMASISDSTLKEDSEDYNQITTGSPNDETASSKRKRDLTEVDEEGPPVRIDKGKQPMRDFEAEMDRELEELEEEVNSFLDDKYLQKVSTDLEGENKNLY